MRTLVVNTARLGDVVMMTPLLEALRPHCERLTVVTAPIGAELLIDHEVWPLLKRPRARGLVALAKMIGRLRDQPFDLAIAAHRSTRTAALIAASGAARSVGFENARRAFWYSDRVAWDADAHQVDRYLALLEPLGIAAPSRQPSLLAASERGDYLCLAPGASRASKCWPIEHYAGLVRALTDRGHRIVVTGGADERELGAQLGRLSPLCDDRTGATTIAELTELLAGARLFIGNDSGTGHLAAAVGTPVVSIFGPTEPSQGYSPIGPDVRTVGLELDCRPCHHTGPRSCPQGHHRCMNDLALTTVLDAVDGALAGDLALTVSDHQGDAGVADDVDRGAAHVERSVDGPDQRGVLGR